MPLDLSPFADAGLSHATLDALISRHERITVPRLSALWDYYRNPLTTTDSASRGPSSRPYTLAQERGLPPRLLGKAGSTGGHLPDNRVWKRKEVVIENDIAWRIHTMIDFIVGRPIAFASAAPDKALAKRIERVLEAVWESSGGASLMQDLALLGHVYGYVDLIIRAADGLADTPATTTTDEHALISAAKAAVRVEVIDPTRGIPLLSTSDFRLTDAYIIRSRREALPSERPSPGRSAAASLLDRWLGKSDLAAAPTRTFTITEIIGRDTRRVYETDDSDPRATPRLLEAGASLVGPARSDEHDETRPVGGPPVVHIQNIGQPLAYEGMSEVEPLIPLQDELNTRLSDRASRVTLQSFKMFLAKGLDGLDRLTVGPGQVVLTSNPDAKIEMFGGDASSPSEDAHIAEIREALDKVSGVPPLAAGVVRAKIGDLTSANALRVTLMGLLSRTARKRIAYGRGLVQASRIVLDALDRAGILRTDPRDRELRVVWPDPLPLGETDALAAAEKKLAIGVPRQQVLAELGYAASDPSVG